jgi:hypothetical protein
MKLKDQRIVGETLELDDGQVHAHAFGPNLELAQCHIKILCAARSLIIGGFAMIEGEFEAAKKQTDTQYYTVRFDRTKISGSFRGCDFGSDGKKNHELGAVVGCDFSNADLDMCRLMNVDIDSCVFAPWPEVVLIGPRNNIQLELISNLPGKWPRIMSSFSKSPEFCSAIVFNVSALERSAGGEFKELRALLQACPFVRIAHG